MLLGYLYLSPPFPFGIFFEIGLLTDGNTQNFIPRGSKSLVALPLLDHGYWHWPFTFITSLEEPGYTSGNSLGFKSHPSNNCLAVILPFHSNQIQVPLSIWQLLSLPNDPLAWGSKNGPRIDRDLRLSGIFIVSPDESNFLCQRNKISFPTGLKAARIESTNFIGA